MGGQIVYQGRSRLGDDSILGIITNKSDNPKTGRMHQLWIILDKINPCTAIKDRLDQSICGQCPHRTNDKGKRSCYVNPMGPNAVYRAYLRGNYKAREFANNLAIRLGAYGDPVALPIELIKSLCAKVKTWTGYTHQWRDNPDYAPYLMASVDNETEYYAANTAGWRTFRVKRASDPLLPNEIMCPNTTKGIQCITCGLCKGTSIKAKNIAIDVHGHGAKYF